MKVNFTINKKDLANIQKMTVDFIKGLERGVGYAAKYLEAEVKKSIGRPGRPQVRTGNLRRSVSSKSKGTTAYVDVNAVYADILEHGGTINGKPWLMFKIGNKFIKTRSVTIPAKPYIQPAIDSSEQKMGDIIGNEITEELNRR